MAIAKPCLVSAVAVGLVVFSLVAACVLAQGSQDLAAAAISEADQAIALGFEAVLSAESAGGNVTSLVAGLNNAAALLSDARRVFNAGDFDGARVWADSAASAVGAVWDDAKKLEVDAGEATANRTMLFLIASCVAVPLVLAVSFLGYRRFKKWYYERLLKMKPKVGEA